MAVTIDRDLLGDLNEPNIEAINYAIRELRSRKSRLDKLANYYNGKQEVENHEFENANVKASNVMVNHAKYITDMNVGFMTGNPVKYTADKGKNIDEVLDVLKNIDIHKHDIELEKDLSVFGYGYELLYLKQTDPITTVDRMGNEKFTPNTELRVEVVDPRAAIVVTDDTVEHEPLFGVFVQEKKDLSGITDGYSVTVYMPKRVVEYRSKLSANLSADDPIVYDSESLFGAVPLIEYRNNEERQGDFEQLISLIDAYNLLQTDRISDKEAFVDALLVTFGFGLGDDKDDIQRLKRGAIEAPPREEGADIEWLTKSFDETQVNLLSQSVENDIHKISYVPNMNDEKFMGNVSGEAMKFKLFGLENLLSIKQRYFFDGLRRRLNLIQTIVNIKGANDDVSGCDISLTANIPVNLSDVVNNIKNADGVIPRKYTYSWLPDVDNPQEVIDEMDQQDAENVRKNQRALQEQDPDRLEVEDSQDDSSTNQEGTEQDNGHSKRTR
ncbi:phage portal protein [Limosilactobacillus sp. STM2_1]|uniref:Phage portal protein n=1 Tax=Limosilactobacillus rudii TaxID=2759755 RepID=A0A7W3YN14_9LACO|nr:phage portal protein [Limosilactobacillus rudii]MBB1080239.1 phage portal protein [Limosilactobacillus rudii]MBB1096857.1 phage portal protein [Limosilactobacillus rudii]MCD7133755.1 phage portal protein [Limosilactobacillus rudii]